ncbi:MAG: saccharopine dehydrogenase family protein [Planctomycetota bacterium]|jgi:saccharopine dehydrogenase-like NADP-dependent oxidoreductase
MTHHVLIAGGGGIGRALALMLRAEASFPCQVTIGDLSLAAAQEAAAFANAKGDDALTTAIQMPAEGVDATLTEALERADSIVDCLPGAQAPRMARLAREHGLNYLNLTEYVAETEQVLEIARGASTCFALQCGLAPGYINILAHDLFQRACRDWGVDKVDSMRMRVGALTRHATAPHFYGWTWSPVGVATEYVKPAIAVRDGETVELPSLSEREQLLVEGVWLEEDLTSGGAADLPQALAGRVRDLDYKTLRFPGHYAWVDTQLAELPDGPDRAARLQDRMMAAIPHCQDDQVIIYADVEGRDSRGDLRAERAAVIVPSIEIDGRELRAIQSTTAAGVAEVLRLIVDRNLSGPLLQSEVPPSEFLNGPFVRTAYGTL